MFVALTLLCFGGSWSCSDFALNSSGDDDTAPQGDDDTDDGTPPPEEVCNGEDDDGDGAVDEGFADTDGDGVADCVDEGCAVTLAEPTMAIDADCEGEVELGQPPLDPWNVTEEWHWDELHCFTTPVVGDLDGDGSVEVVVSCTDGDLYTPGSLVILDGATGTTELVVAETGICAMGGIALGDITGNGTGDIVTTLYDEYDGDGEVVAYDHTGAHLWTTATYTHVQQGNYPTLTDLEGDGAVEVLVGNLIIEGATGVVRATLESGPQATVYGTPVAVDMDLDGVQEILFMNRLHAADGSLLWTCGPGGLTALAHPIDIDDDDQGEFLAAAWGELTLCDDDGTELWTRETNAAGCAATVADFDGDGVQEFVYAENEKLRLIDDDGVLMWQTESHDVSGLAGLTSLDIDLDGIPEVVYADELNVLIIDGASGMTRVEIADHQSWTNVETPAAADVDGDGHIELLYTSNYGDHNGVTVLGGADGDWPYGPPVYNQYGYWGANVGLDLSIPSQPVQPWLQQSKVYRGQPSERYVAAALNVRGEITDACAASCDPGGYAEVAIQVINDGGVTLDAGASVGLYGTSTGQMLLIEGFTLPHSLAPGASWETAVETTAEELETVLMLLVDEEDWLVECHEDDNLTTEVVNPCQE